MAVIYDGPDLPVAHGYLAAHYISNLMGHFGLQVEAIRLKDYRAGQLSRYRAGFYVGTVQNTVLPPAFLKDVKSSARPFAWLGLHIDQLLEEDPEATDLVHTLQGGWTTDMDRGPVSLTFDLALGAGRSREHGADFGPWGVSAYAGSYLTWTIGDRSELTASYEYSYDKSSPPLEPSPSATWRMNAVTVSFRWTTK